MAGGGGRRRWVLIGGAVVPALLVIGSNLRLWRLSAGHRFAAPEAPSAPVVIVPGAKVAPDGSPMAYLRGRLDAAIELVRAGRAGEILVSGAASRASGDEIDSMTSYLVKNGVDLALIRADGAGLSTWATCLRAKQLFGIDRALIVTQRRHLPRAVALCRAAGIHADGVVAPCEARKVTKFRNTIREWFAAPKAVLRN
ncbi:YdcF family protein [Nocardia sp. NBC_00881]|uniref:SanA/YdcF family protein n=1 Tax=Nocardia sp. NBC_00881 TaxID=2975995 RepID=UPI00386DA4AE|nr:YdcF family protein [Nocardia sp. NBC_00881]